VSKVITEWNQARVLAEVSGRVADNLHRACQFAAEEAKRRAPRRTGQIVREIDVAVEVTARNQEITGWVGVKKGNAFYAYFQEVGTSRHPAHPFLRPAVFGNARQIVAIVSGK
jgi:HK97 gp10 family phage protein